VPARHSAFVMQGVPAARAGRGPLSAHTSTGAAELEAATLVQAAGGGQALAPPPHTVWHTPSATARVPVTQVSPLGQSLVDWQGAEHSPSLQVQGSPAQHGAPGGKAQKVLPSSSDVPSLPVNDWQASPGHSVNSAHGWPYSKRGTQTSSLQYWLSGQTGHWLQGGEGSSAHRLSRPSTQATGALSEKTGSVHEAGRHQGSMQITGTPSFVGGQSASEVHETSHEMPSGKSQPAYSQVPTAHLSVQCS